MMTRERPLTPAGLVVLALLCCIGLLWSTPLLWMLVASFQDIPYGSPEAANLLPTRAPTLDHVTDALGQGDFLLWYANTAILCLGVLAVQLVTITLGGYAFARMDFPGKGVLFYVFLLQLALAAPILIVPNTLMVVRLGLYDTLPGIMLPYFASAFGVFLMRQTFRTIPTDFEDAARLDGANFMQMLVYVLVPLARPGLVAFAIVSISAHWNEFLWPLMVTDSPDRMVVTVGLASFVKSAEAAADWGLVAASSLLVCAPLLVAFALFQRQFVSSFLFTGVK